MKTKKIKALIIEDSEDDLKLMLRELQKGSSEIEYRLVIDAKGLEIALEEEWDIIISDYLLPDFTGFDALKMCNEKEIDTPFIIVSGTIGEELAVEMMKTGVKDYIMKNNLARLLPSIEREIGEAENRKEKKHAEEKLKESEEHFRSLYENSTIGLYRTTPDGKVLLANPTLVNILGYSSFEELSTTDLTKDGFAPLYPRSLFIDSMEKEGLVKGLESSWRRKDGTNIFVSESASVIKNSKGKIIYYDGTVEDITERKHAEDKLIETKNYLENLINNANAPIIVWDTEFKITRFNKAFEIISGYNSADMIGEEFYILFPEETKNKSLEEIGKTLRGDKWESVEIPILCSNGNVKIILWNSSNIYDNNGKTLIATIAQGLDITERKKAEELLMQSEENYRNLVENVNVGVYSSTIDGIIIKANKKLYDMLGYDTIKDSSKFLLTDIYYDKDERKEVIRILSNEGMIHNKELKIKKKNGKPVWIYLSAKASYDKSGKIYRIDGVVDDISEEKMLRDELKLSEELFRKVNSSALDAVIIIDDSGKITFWNQSAERIFGWTSEEVIGKKFHTIFVQKKHQENFNKNFPEYIKTGKGNVIGKITEMSAVKKDGTIFPVEISLNSIEVNEKRHAIGVVRDITERKQAEKEKVRLASFPQLNPYPVIEVDAVGHIHYANPSATKLLPSLEKEDFRHPWLAGLESLFATFQEAGRGFTIREIKIGELWYYQSLYYVPATQCIRIYALDITKRMKAEEALRQSEERFKQVSENASEWIWEVDKNGLYTYSSPIVTEISGYAPEEIVNKKYFYEFLIPEDRENIKQLTFEAFARKESFKDFINHILHKDGREIILSTSSVPILDNAGNLIGYRGVDIDVTEQKKAEELLKNSESSLRYAQEIAEMGSWEWDVITNKTNWSDNYFAILGLKPGEVEPSFEFFRNRIHPDDVHILDLSQANTNKNKIPASFEMRIILPDGTIKWLQANIVPIIENDKIVKLKGVIIDITVRKLAEELLKESESSLRYAQEIAEMGSWEWNLVLQKTHWSENCFAILGLKPTEFEPTFEFYRNKIHPDDVHILDLSYANMMKNKTPDSFELRIIMPGGTIKWLQTNLVSIIENDKIVKLKGVIIDITQRKKAELDIINSKKLLQRIIDLLPIRIFWKDNNLRYLGCNEIFAKDAGKERTEDLIGKDDFRMGWKEQAKLYRDDDKSVINSGVPKLNFEEPQTTPEGNTIWIKTSKVPLTDVQGNAIGILGSYEDITERKKAEETLRKSEEQFRTLIENQGEGIGITDLNETFVFANPAAHEIFGVPEGSLVGKHLSDFISTDSFEKIKIYTEQKRENKKSIYELEIYRPDGEKRILHLTTTPRFDDKNQLTGAFGIFRDITESKTYESEILLAKEKAEESERIKANFLANMSHELRTPMVGILGYTELMKENLEDSELKEMADAIYTSGKRLMETLNLILDLSIIEQGKVSVNVKKTDIVNIAEDVLNLFQASALKKNLILAINSLFENYFVNLDGKLLFQVFSNLVNNGIKFTKSGSVIIEIAKETISGKEWAVIKVKDTGMGIPEDKTDVIFEEFRQVSEGYSRSFEGTGLGLTITKNFVEIMNGNISVESKLGSGTVFTVKFPTNNRPSPDAVNIKLLDDESKQIILPSGDYKILCVDDDDTNNSLVGLILGENYKLDFVLTADKAIELSNINKYDIILMDINLGYGMTGIDVIREIKKSALNKNTPVIALTAFTMKGDMQEFLANGCDYYLSKPYTTRALKELVKKIIKKKK